MGAFFHEVHCKPVSRILWAGLSTRLATIYLSTGLPRGIHLPTHPFIRLRGGVRAVRPPLRSPVRDIRIYMAFQHARFTPSSHHCGNARALTPHFHPHPPGSLPDKPAFQQVEAVIFCGTVCSDRLRGWTRLFTGAPPCAVRTFLPARRRRGGPACNEYVQPGEAGDISSRKVTSSQEYWKWISVAPYPKEGWNWFTKYFTSRRCRRISWISSRNTPLPTPCTTMS